MVQGVRQTAKRTRKEVTGETETLAKTPVGLQSTFLNLISNHCEKNHGTFCQVTWD